MPRANAPAEMKYEDEGWRLLKGAGKTGMCNAFFHNIVVAYSTDGRSAC